MKKLIKFFFKFLKIENKEKIIKKTFIRKKEQKKTDGPDPRTNGESKAIQTKSHPEAYTYTLTKRGKGKNIYISMYKKKEKGRERPNQ